MSFAAAVAFILEREGGYVDDPKDRGGATKYGITHGTLARARGAPVTKADVQALRITEAVGIYEEHYWKASSAHVLDDLGLHRLAICHVDAAVNHGSARAIKLLQATVGVKADGVFGPLTRAAVLGANEDEAIAEYLRRRAAYFRAIVAHDDSQAKFLVGWLARCRHVARECGVPIDPSYARA